MALYKDPQDSRVFVPKQGGGMGLNFAHPIAWAIVVSMTVIPVVVVTVTTIALLL
ncbi:DUF5808 domain-containing protein [Paractinoplanes rishiriensis]|uniref:DUF5808 domain-containing protein n=1 Tax=Paractinoplanes rishiriensis TaxID=1050105 RepID=A0A919JXV1_9ACTN|nr:DUF5808 domain-containing protein [Actinoplanes rishiriensis]GIE96748.1 hypothetical protein Ari01nite_42130 [Actinoplanes rishiriensis]